VLTKVSIILLDPLSNLTYYLPLRDFSHDRYLLARISPVTPTSLFVVCYCTLYLQPATAPRGAFIPLFPSTRISDTIGFGAQLFRLNCWTLCD
jgi:hypothetical protein